MYPAGTLAGIVKIHRLRTAFFELLSDSVGLIGIDLAAKRKICGLLPFKNEFVGIIHNNPFLILCNMHNLVFSNPHCGQYIFRFAKIDCIKFMNSAY